jgi:MFS family permease
MFGASVAPKPDFRMSTSIAPARLLTSRLLTWRTPAIILIAGCVIGALGFGPRSALGLFLTPMSSANGWGRDVFGLALALQMLLWGAGQPLAGAIADRFGAVPVLCTGAILYALGLGLMAYSTSPGMLYLTAGVLVGFGLSGSSFQIVLGAFGKLMPPEWRLIAFGAGTAAGSFGQFLFSPVAVGLIDSFGWKATLVIFAAVVLLMMPFALPLATPEAKSGEAISHQSLGHALREAMSHPSYVLLVLGFFTCGFQLFFITVHLPAYLVDRGLSAEIGAWTIGVIGLFNIIGALSAGWLANRMPKRYLLAVIYFLRSVAVLAFIILPPTPLSAVVFGAAMGLLWLSTVPPTNGLVVVMFGTRWLTTLAGLAFFSHQVGGFLGVWLGGVLFERTGSYDVVWWLSILLGVLSALINLPIVEKPVERLAAAPA